MCFCGISHSNLINNRLHVGARARPHRFARRRWYTRTRGSGCVRVRARRNIGRAHCDESVLIITLVRGTSRDAFADTYDKLSVYQQISFPNPAIFPLVYPRPSGEHRALRPASRYSLPFACVHVCISGRSARLSRAQECDDSGRESVFTQ